MILGAASLPSLHPPLLDCYIESLRATRPAGSRCRHTDRWFIESHYLLRGYKFRFFPDKDSDASILPRDIDTGLFLAGGSGGTKKERES